MGIHIFLAIAILALAFITTMPTLVHASDHSPPQDFCIVAASDEESSLFVNGLFCRDPELATPEDFFFSGLLTPGNTSNPWGVSIISVAAAQLRGLNTLGISMYRIDYAPKGFIPPHTNPRASEMILVLEGTLQVGFVTSNNLGNRLFAKELKPGEVFVFPQGLIHYQFNRGHTNAVAIAALNSQDPGLITIPSAVFGSEPRIDNDVLAKAFEVKSQVIQLLQKQFRTSNS